MRTSLGGEQPFIYVVGQYIAVRPAIRGSNDSVLLVAEPNSWADAIVNYFRDEPISVHCADGSVQAEALATYLAPKAIVIDLDANGIGECDSVCWALRRIPHTYVIALGSDTDKLALCRGDARLVDEFIVKPFVCRDIAARISGVIACAQAKNSAAQRTNPSLSIDVDRREVRRGGFRVDLTRTQFDILAILAEEPGAIVTRAEIVNAVWGRAWNGSANIIDVHIGHLRRRLGDNPALPHIVLNVRGRGFRVNTDCWYQESACDRCNHLAGLRTGVGRIAP